MCTRKTWRNDSQSSGAEKSRNKPTKHRRRLVDLWIDVRSQIPKARTVLLEQAPASRLVYRPLGSYESVNNSANCCSTSNFRMGDCPDGRPHAHDLIRISFATMLLTRNEECCTMIRLLSSVPESICGFRTNLWPGRKTLVTPRQNMQSFISTLLHVFPAEQGAASTDQLVDPEKVVFRHIEVEYFVFWGAAEGARRSILASGRTGKCAQKLRGACGSSLPQPTGPH